MKSIQINGGHVGKDCAASGSTPLLCAHSCTVRDLATWPALPALAHVQASRHDLQAANLLESTPYSKSTRNLLFVRGGG